MSRRTVHGILLAAFVLLLAVPVVRKYGLWTTPEKKVAHYGFALEEVARKSGIDFVHRGPTFDAKLSHIMPHVAAMGAAVSVVDFDRDGWQDLYVTNSAVGAANRLYRNLGNGQFEDVAERVGVANLNPAGTGISVGAVWGGLRQRRLRRSFRVQMGSAGVVAQRGRTGVHPGERGRGFARLDQRRKRGLAGLRLRRASGSVCGRLLAGCAGSVAPGIHLE